MRGLRVTRLLCASLSVAGFALLPAASAQAASVAGISLSASHVVSGWGTLVQQFNVQTSTADITGIGLYLHGVAPKTLTWGLRTTDPGSSDPSVGAPWSLTGTYTPDGVDGLIVLPLGAHHGSMALGVAQYLWVQPSTAQAVDVNTTMSVPHTGVGFTSLAYGSGLAITAYSSTYNMPFSLESGAQPTPTSTPSSSASSPWSWTPTPSDTSASVTIPAGLTGGDYFLKIECTGRIGTYYYVTEFGTVSGSAYSGTASVNPSGFCSGLGTVNKLWVVARNCDSPSSSGLYVSATTGCAVLLTYPSVSAPVPTDSPSPSPSPSPTAPLDCSGNVTAPPVGCPADTGDPDSANSGCSGWNPLTYVKCALKWAFVPGPTAMYSWNQFVAAFSTHAPFSYIAQGSSYVMLFYSSTAAGFNDPQGRTYSDLGLGQADTQYLNGGADFPTMVLTEASKAGCGAYNAVTQSCQGGQSTTRRIEGICVLVLGMWGLWHMIARGITGRST